MKKQILTLCLVLLLLGALPVRAADGHSYTLSDFGITLTMPDMGAVFTRDLPADDPNWERYGLTKESFLPLMEDRNIYLSEFSPDINLEISVAIEESITASYATLSEQELEADIRDWIASGLVDDGEVYSHPQVLFEKITSTLTDGGNRLSYITTYNGYVYYITLFCYDGQITAEREAMMDELVDSIVFDTAAPLSSAFEYTDEATGATFLVPENWSEPVLLEGNDYNPFFYPLENPSILLLYSSVDLRAALDGTEDQDLSPSELDAWCRDNLDLCLSSLLGMEDPDPVVCTYGDQTYYAVTQEGFDLDGDAQASLTITHMVSFHNGYLFWFQYMGDPSGPLYADFESILTGFRPEGAASSFPASVLSLLPYLAIALVVILLLIVLWVILRRRKKAARGIAAGAVPAAPLDGTDSKWQNAGSTQNLPQSGVELLEQLRDEMDAQQTASTPQSGIELLEQLRDEMEAASAAPNTKRCPRCGREMPAFAVTCPCGFNYADPKSNTPYHPEAEEMWRIHKGELKPQSKQCLLISSLIVLCLLIDFFVVSRFSFRSPVAGLICSILSPYGAIAIIVIIGVRNVKKKHLSSTANPLTPPSGTASGAPSDPAAAAPPSTPESSKPPQENPRDPA